MLAGNTAARSRLVWAPSGAKYQPFKEAPYKDEFDEWLARIVCYAFSLPATAFTKQVNRATAETTQEAAVPEGLAPLMGWVKRLADHVIQDRFFAHDLEFAWADLKPEDPDRQSSRHVAEPEAVEAAIRQALSGAPLLPGFNSGAVNVNGTWYIYPAFLLPDGSIRVGTYLPW